MRSILMLLCLCLFIQVNAQETVKLKKRDRRRDVLMQTTEGAILLRLSDATPLHRDNFLRLVKTRFYDSILFHRVIKGFVIQAGDPGTRHAKPGQQWERGGPTYKIPAEIRPELYHHKGVLAAAREGDAVNPERKSSASQFYIVQGRTFTDAALDSVERVRLGGRQIMPERRKVYRETGGTPQLDGSYTIFGQVVQGLDVVERIAQTPTSTSPADRPVTDMRILSARLVKRKRPLQ